MRTVGWYHRAILARLKAATVGVAVTDREPAVDAQGKPPPRYLQVLTTGGNRPAELARMSGETPRDLPVMVMAVGILPDEALDALEQCDLALIGWDIDPADSSASLIVRDSTTPPIVPYRSVEGDHRYSITPTYRLGSDR